MNYMPYLNYTLFRLCHYTDINTLCCDAIMLCGFLVSFLPPSCLCELCLFKKVLKESSSLAGFVNISNHLYGYPHTVLCIKAGLKLSIQKLRSWHQIPSDTIPSWQIDGEKVKTVTDFIFLGSKITVDSDCSPKKYTCSLEEKIWQT